ncbi:MAG: hypothetical protein ACQES5_09565 [Thermodesulfobacteriota bacterium]
MKHGEVRQIDQIVTLPKQTKQEREKEFKYFKDNFNLILKYSALIINTPRYFHSYLECSIINLAYMGGYYAPIGALIQLWKKDIFVGKCQECSGKLYFFQGGGSLLSGSNRCMGICEKCGTVSCKKIFGIKELLKAFEHIKKNINTRSILRTKGQYFSFKEGLVGNPVPDKIIEAGIKPVTMTKLLNDLREVNGQESKQV